MLVFAPLLVFSYMLAAPACGEQPSVGPAWSACSPCVLLVPDAEFKRSSCGAARGSPPAVQWTQIWSETWLRDKSVWLLLSGLLSTPLWPSHHYIAAAACCYSGPSRPCGTGLFLTCTRVLANYDICVLLLRSAQHGKLIGGPLQNQAARYNCTAQANLMQRSA